MNKRILIGIFLSTIIIIGLVYCFLNRETMFKNVVNIGYPDGCQESYTNGQLTTEPCDYPLNNNSVDDKLINTELWTKNN